MHLPDPGASRAVLIGTSNYKELDQLPAIARNLESLQALFTSPDLWGLPARNCRIIPDPKSPAEVLDTIHRAASEADDTLLVYYAGHGLLDPYTDDLYLALTNSEPDRLYTAIRYEDLRREMIEVAHAAAKVVLLDCCYSGRAMLGGMSGSTEIADQARIEGTYLMTASADTVKAQAPVGEEFTAFTGEIVTALGSGLPDGPDLLNVETLYWHVRAQLVAKRRPTPQQRAGNDGGMIVLARNRRGVRSAVHAVPTAVRRALPEAPSGYQQMIRRPPKEILEQLSALAESGRHDIRSQLIAAAAARRPDQEVAAMIGLLRMRGRDADADQMIEAAAIRPAAEVLALFEALQETGMNADADNLLDACGRGPAEDIGALAERLQHVGRHRDVERLLDAATNAHGTSEEVIALVGTLWSVGLGDEINGVLSRVARQLTDVEALALADALRAACRDEAAFLLYSGAFAAVARRSADEVAGLVHAMRDSGRLDDAKALLDAVNQAGHTPQETVGIAVAMWSVSLDEEVQYILDVAASKMVDTDVAALAAALRELDHNDAALHLCIQAAGRQSVATALTLIDALRDSGRPIDANRLVESSRSWPTEKVAEFIAALERAGSRADAERAVNSVSRRGTKDVWSLVAELHRYRMYASAERLAHAALGREVTVIGEIVHSLRAAGCSEDTSRLIALAVQGEWSDISSFAIGLHKSGSGKDADQLLALAARRPVADICQIAVAMRAERDISGAERLLGVAAATLQVTDVVSLIELLFRQDSSAIAAIWPALVRRPLEIVVDAIRLLMQRNLEVDLPSVINNICERSNEDLVAFIVAVHDRIRGADVGRMLGIAAKRRYLADAYLVASSLKARGIVNAGNRFLEIAVAESPMPEIVSTIRGLRAHRRAEDAEILLNTAVIIAPPADILTMIDEFGHVNFRNHDTRRILEVFGVRRSPQEIRELETQLRTHGYPSEAYRMMKVVRAAGRKDFP